MYCTENKLYLPVAITLKPIVAMYAVIFVKGNCVSMEVENSTNFLQAHTPTNLKTLNWKPLFSLQWLATEWSLFAAWSDFYALIYTHTNARILARTNQNGFRISLCSTLCQVFYDNLVTNLRLFLAIALQIFHTRLNKWCESIKCVVGCHNSTAIKHK